MIAFFLGKKGLPYSLPNFCSNFSLSDCLDSVCIKVFDIVSSPAIGETCS
jgi:hypothetical protein